MGALFQGLAAVVQTLFCTQVVERAFWAPESLVPVAISNQRCRSLFLGFLLFSLGKCFVLADARISSKGKKRVSPK